MNLPIVKNNKLEMPIDYILEEPSGQLKVQADIAFIAIYPTLSKNIRINEISSIIRRQVISEVEAQFKKKLKDAQLQILW